jgi:hypothetical protein
MTFIFHLEDTLDTPRTQQQQEMRPATSEQYEDGAQGETRDDILVRRETG